MIKNTPNNFKQKTINPFVKLANLMRFIKQRRKDNHLAILSWPKLSLYFVLFLICIAVAFAFIDQPFFDAYRAKTTYKSIYFNMLTHVADSSWVLIATGIILLSFGFISGDKFTGKQHGVWHRMFFTNWFIFYSIGMSGLLVNIFKYLFGRARPNFVNGESAFDFTFFNYGYEYASFPSGHSTTAGALMVCLLLLFARYKIFFIILGILIASTRPLVGAHFPSDVVAGLAFGSVFTWLYARSMAKNRLLFKFSKNGNLLLRQEGYGYCHKIPSMILQCFTGKKK